ncbi:MAG: NlpC/P60 family protein [Alphaproteobacteria bacterium]|nr:NlpC/P60 family protein [Alphaproteobacteria bacterium]
MKKNVITSTADVREKPDPALPHGYLETQLVYGEDFIVEKEDNDWSYGHCAHDNYPGWVETRCLGDRPDPTHTVTARTTFTFSNAESKMRIKAPRVQHLSFASRVTVTDTQHDFCLLDTGDWIFSGHISPLEEYDTDYVTTAMKFLGTPYAYAGRSGFGLDCSALVQLILARAGIKAQRDVNQQYNTIGEETGGPAQKGDFVIFPEQGRTPYDHIGVMIDDKNILHNVYRKYAMTVIEPLDDLATRCKGITTIRRIPGIYS